MLVCAPFVKRIPPAYDAILADVCGVYRAPPDLLELRRWTLTECLRQMDGDPPEPWAGPLSANVEHHKNVEVTLEPDEIPLVRSIQIRHYPRY